MIIEILRNMATKKESGESSVTLFKESHITTKRFVAFLDIMGFKDRVARNEHDEILKELEVFQSNISQYVSYHSEANVQISLFSDSILIYSQNDSVDSLHALADITSHIMMYAIHQEKPIPLKGAIAAGVMTCNPTKQLYFGQALIDAYLLEENVKYYGVLVHHSAEKYLKKDKFLEFRDVKAPLKSGEIYHYELSWYNVKLESAKNGEETTQEKIQVDVSECLNNLRLTVSDEPRKYIDNTKKVMDSIKYNGND